MLNLSRNHRLKILSRIHLFEFEDQQWFPGFIRNYMTDFLQFTANLFDFYSGIIPVLEKGLDSIKSQKIIDLASGGGGGWMKLSTHLSDSLPDVSVHLTDYYPNISAFEHTQSKLPELITYSAKSINALDVPSELEGLRTQFLSFHHFNKIDATSILQNAVDAKSPIAIFEAQQRSISDLIKFFFSPINVALVTPFIRPFKIGRIIFTYIIPLVPAVTWWDGLVSVLRTYSPKELEEMIETLDGGETFDWEIDFVKSGPVKIHYLLGVPNNKEI